MPKLTRIYTRTGDDGTTGLVGGQRVKKNALRIETYGTVDECSSAIGMARSALRPLLATHARAARLDTWLAWVQDALFNLGSDLATMPKDRWEGMPLIAHEDAVALERAIDEAQRDLPHLNNFIHPGGSQPDFTCTWPAPSAAARNDCSSPCATKTTAFQRKRSNSLIAFRMRSSFGRDGLMRT